MSDKLKTCHHRKDEPIGYLARQEWFIKMSKTHKQKKCSKCGLFHIWIRRGETMKYGKDASSEILVHLYRGDGRDFIEGYMSAIHLKSVTSLCLTEEYQQTRIDLIKAFLHSQSFKEVRLKVLNQQIKHFEKSVNRRANGKDNG